MPESPTQEAFDKVVQNAEVKEETLHSVLLMNLTTSPKVSKIPLGLIWMQRSPVAWAGYHPEVCWRVAEVIGLGEQV